MTEVTEYATTFGLLQWDADLSAVKAHDDPQPPKKGEGWTLVTACLGALGPTMGPGKQLLVWTWQREVGLSAASVAKTVGVPVPDNATAINAAIVAKSAEDRRLIIPISYEGPLHGGAPVPRSRPHLVNGEFQSDKYPSCPRGKVPMSCKDNTAQDLLWTYAQRRRAVDAEFADDLEEALRIAGYVPQIRVPPSQAPTPPEPRWTLSTESAEDSWGGNQVRRVLRDGKWAATATTDVASEIVAAMNERERGAGGLDADELIVACANIGFDLRCGSCASQFYTGTSTYEHDPKCESSLLKKRAAEARDREWAAAWWGSPGAGPSSPAEVEEWFTDLLRQQKRHTEAAAKSAAVEALRDAAGALVAGACDDDDGDVQWLRTRADRIERGEKP